MKLVIVESPSKIHTIKQYLGKEFDCVASKGHVREIKDSGIDNLGLDFKNNLKPIYCVIDKQYETIKMINDKIKDSDFVYLATDPDREGEAISWHLKETLNLKGKEVKRIEFNEITKNAILTAIDNPRDIDMNLVASQETRKIIDRVIGYKLSGFIQNKAKSSGSAGRVQSVALKLINDRENEVQNFIPETYYEIEADNDSFKAKLLEYGKNKDFKTNDKDLAEEIYKSLSKEMIVESINITEKHEKSAAPFNTSDLYQAASRKYSMSSSRTAKAAQHLYEGIVIDGHHTALITYMRTDARRLSSYFTNAELIPYIKNTYGEEYLGYLHKGKTSEFAQDAHEAIRPVSLKYTPDSVKENLDKINKDLYKVYSLIFDRTVESIMKDSTIEEKEVIFINNNQRFHSFFDRYTFLGFKKAESKTKSSEKPFLYQIGDILKFSKIELKEKKTEGPSRYDEASLIKEMETLGIGRPSTYASTVQTLKFRKYIEEDKKKFVPTLAGKYTSKLLDTYFSEFINVGYTANMEKKLDEIASGNEKEELFVLNFYSDFKKKFDLEVSNRKTVETGESCPICGSPMVFKKSNFGVFEACSNFPTCSFIKKDPPTKKDGAIPTIECPECHIGHLVERTAKGKKFYGCSCFPNCKYTTSKLPIKKK